MQQWRQVNIMVCRYHKITNIRHSLAPPDANSSQTVEDDMDSEDEEHSKSIVYTQTSSTHKINNISFSQARSLSFKTDKEMLLLLL